MKNNVFLTALLFLMIVSCKKETLTKPVTPPDPLPIILEYNTNTKFAVLKNNLDSSRKLSVYDSTNKVTFTYNSGNNFGYFFPQYDSGEIYYSADIGVHNSYYGVIRSDKYIGTWLLEFKAGYGENDFSLSPGLVTDSTKEIVMIAKFGNKKRITISGDDFRKQGFFIFYYDKK